MLDFLVLAAGGIFAFLLLPNEWMSGIQGLLAPLFLVSVFWFTCRRGPLVSALGGAAWIALVTLLSQSWLIGFHPAAFPLTLLLQTPLYAAAFAVSSFLWRFRPAAGLWLQALWWTIFEFLRVQGFLAFPYGSVASAFWAWPLVFQSAELVGTSGLTFLLAWSSAWLAALAAGALPWRRLRLDLGAGLALWGLNLGYGAWQLGRPEQGDLWRPALVQQASDPWKSGPEAYESALDELLTLSRAAALNHPDAVIWSETAFVPSVEYHLRYRESASSLRLVRRLEDFLAGQTVPYLIGNDHREKNAVTEDFNAVLSWNAAWSGRYEKVRLVPFTETFPFRDLLPGVYDWLKSQDTHFWQPGKEYNVLRAGGVPVGTPVCYEDTFPEASRAFALAGARALANVTNDSWAPGTASRLQHLSLAVFRAVETRLPLVRAGNDGATAAVSSRGELLALLPVGPPGTLQAEVRLGGQTLTLYTQWGDWFVAVCVALTGIIASWSPRRVVDKRHEL